MRAELADVRARHARAKEALSRAKGARDAARAEVAELEEELRRERRRTQAAEERAAGLGEAHRRLRATALGVRDARELDPAPGHAPEGDEAREQEREMAWLRARSLFTRAVANGDGLAGAFMVLLRRTHGVHQMTETRQIAQWLHDHGPDPQTGALATGLVAQRMGLPTFAWERLSSLPPEVWVPHAPGEFVHLAGQHDIALAERAVRAVLEHEGTLSAATWLAVTRRAMGIGLGDLCPAVADRFDQAARAEIDSGELTAAQVRRLERQRAWMTRWAPRIAAGPVRPAAATPGTIAVGVMGYDQPDPRNTSRNIGDHVQTVASLAHVVRHTGARFDDGELGRFAREQYKMKQHYMRNKVNLQQS